MAAIVAKIIATIKVQLTLRTQGETTGKGCNPFARLPAIY